MRVLAIIAAVAALCFVAYRYGGMGQRLQDANQQIETEKGINDARDNAGTGDWRDRLQRHRE